MLSDLLGIVHSNSNKVLLMLYGPDPLLVFLDLVSVADYKIYIYCTIATLLFVSSVKWISQAKVADSGTKPMSPDV